MSEHGPRATEDLERVLAAVHRADVRPGSRATSGAGSGASPRATAGPSGEADPAQEEEELLRTLASLHRLRGLLSAWEPTLIAEARDAGASWASLASAMGVSSRQAAEQRFLRLRRSDDPSLTGEQRVRATRDQRAGDRAVASWARDNAAHLRQVAGQVSALTDLGAAGRRKAQALRTSLAADDPADLLPPLAAMRQHLVAGHPRLSAEVEAISRRVDRVTRQIQGRSAPPGGTR